VNLQTGQWTARKLDKEETKKVVADNSCSAEAARVNKSLMPGDGLIKDIASNISDFRQNVHYVMTMPWGDDGWRLIPAASIGEYRKLFRAAEDRHSDLVSQMVQDYHAKVAAAQAMFTGLGKLFKATDYPQSSQIASKYRFSCDWNSISDADDLRVSISEEAAAEIRREMKAANDAKLNGAVKDTYERVHGAVAKLVDRLGNDANGDAKIFRDSLLDNVKELCEVLPGLNITGDPLLAGIVDKLHGQIAGLECDDLRVDARAGKAKREAQAVVVEENKAKVMKTAQDILADLAGAL